MDLARSSFGGRNTRTRIEGLGGSDTDSVSWKAALLQGRHDFALSYDNKRSPGKSSGRAIPDTTPWTIIVCRGWPPVTRPISTPLNKAGQKDREASLQQNGRNLALLAEALLGFQKNSARSIPTPHPPRLRPFFHDGHR